jgi:hypothetical protein
MNKYRNKPTVVDGIRFASQAEAKRYAELQILQRAKRIMGLTCHPRFPLMVNGHLIATYVGDFGYRELLPRDMSADVRWGLSALLMDIVEDVKGCETELFKLKAKLFEVLYPEIELRVIYSGRGSSKRSVALRRAIA